MILLADASACATPNVSVVDLGRTAIGTWSGGRFMHFGEQVDDARLEALFRPGDGIDTVLTADVYGEGEADRVLGRALAGVERSSFCLVGAVGHDFYEGERDGPRGFPRFTHPGLRGAGDYAAYLRRATERSLARIGADAFDLLLLHNPDRTGYESEAVWNAMGTLREAELTREIGVAPGPANGFTLDLIACLERYGEAIDWAMIILNPTRAVAGRARAGRSGASRCPRDHPSRRLRRPVLGRPSARNTARPARPPPVSSRGLGRSRPREGRCDVADRGQSRPHPASACLCLEPQPPRGRMCRADPHSGGRPGVASRRGKALGARRFAREPPSSLDDLERIRAIGDNTGCMALKGASPEHEGEERPDRWGLSSELAELATRWGIEPARDLRNTRAAVG